MPLFIKRMRPRAREAHQVAERIRELVESVGCKLQYLPPYLPDLSKIKIEHRILMVSHQKSSEEIKG